MESMAPFKLWICLATIGCVLGTVTALTMRSVTSPGRAIIAIRVAHLDLFWARIVFRDPAVHQAEFHLNQAWSHFRDRQYAQSVSAARAALQEVRDIKSGLPSLYSSGRHERKSESGNLPVT
jgi:hypothetical protein